ncbi:hypothetical protein ACP70R_035328 [Stipagrostis hirtigluma subsp. patula]
MEPVIVSTTTEGSESRVSSFDQEASSRRHQGSGTMCLMPVDDTTLFRMVLPLSFVASFPNGLEGPINVSFSGGETYPIEAHVTPAGLLLHEAWPEIAKNEKLFPGCTCMFTYLGPGCLFVNVFAPDGCEISRVHSNTLETINQHAARTKKWRLYIKECGLHVTNRIKMSLKTLAPKADPAIPIYVAYAGERGQIREQFAFPPRYGTKYLPSWACKITGRFAGRGKEFSFRLLGLRRGYKLLIGPWATMVRMSGITADDVIVFVFWFNGPDKLNMDVYKISYGPGSRSV